MTRYYLALLGFALILNGCSSTKKATDDEAPPYYLGAFEDFDDTEYEDVIPPLEPAAIEHDIPAKLHSKSSGVASQVRGFRVQVFSSLNRAEANEAMQQAISWWEKRSDRETDRPPVYMEYEQPYYKVRAGNFKTRASASAMVRSMGRRFAGAFVVPSPIESRR